MRHPRHSPNGYKGGTPAPGWNGISSKNTSSLYVLSLGHSVTKCQKFHYPASPTKGHNILSGRSRAWLLILIVIEISLEQCNFKNKTDLLHPDNFLYGAFSDGHTLVHTRSAHMSIDFYNICITWKTLKRPKVKYTGKKEEKCPIDRFTLAANMPVPTCLSCILHIFPKEKKRGKE